MEVLASLQPGRNLFFAEFNLATVLAHYNLKVMNRINENSAVNEIIDNERAYEIIKN